MTLTPDVLFLIIIAVIACCYFSGRRAGLVRTLIPIATAFASGKAFIPFITCADPDLDTTKRAVYALLFFASEKQRGNAALFAGMCLYTALNYAGQRLIVFREAKK